MYTDPEEAKMAYGKAEHCFLESLKLSPHDTEIVKNLAVIVEEQVNSRGCQHSDDTENQLCCPKLDCVPCQLFK